MIELKYPIVLEDYLDAYRATLEYNFNRPWVRWGLLRGLPVFLIISGLCCVWSVRNFLSNLDLDSAFLLVLGGFNVLLGIVFPLLMRPIFISRSYFHRQEYERAWQNTPSMREARTVTATEIGLTLKGETWETFWKWKACYFFIETEQGFLIRFYSGESKFFPKRIFNSEAQIDEFRELLKKQIGAERFSLL